jgi:hypothetical protein
MKNRTAGSRSTSLLLPLLLALSSAPALGASAPPAKVEDPIAASQAALESTAYDACQAGTIDLLGANPKTAALAAKVRKLLDSHASNYLVLHQACLASIPGEERSCDRLEGLKNGKKNCQDNLRYYSLVDAIVNNGDARAVCADYTISPHPSKKPKKHAEKCDFVIAAIRRGSRDVCGEAQGAGLMPEKFSAQCHQTLAYFDGVPDHCAASPDKTGESLCREKAALLNGLRSKDFHACALSPWCLAATSHKAQACDPYLTEANKLFCDHVAEVVVPLRKEKADRDAKLQAQKSKQKQVFKKGEPMHVMDPNKSLKRGEAPPQPPQK